MIDEKIIEGLREYLKDNYIPPHVYMVSGIVGSLGAASQIRGNTVSKGFHSLRNISDDASEYIKKYRNPGGFARALDRKRKEKGLTPAL